MKRDEPLTREQLRKSRPPMRHIYISQRENLSKTQKFATWITEKIGTMGFFYILIIWTFGWFFWNLYAPVEMRFDAFPSFVLWVFISNMLQLFFLPIIMVGQNLQERHSDARAQADFELNQIAELEIDTVLMHLENQNEDMMNVLNKTDKILIHLEKQNDLIISILNKLEKKAKK